MTDKNKKQKSRGKRAGNIIFLLCCMAVGAVTGYNIAKYADLNLDDLSAGSGYFYVYISDFSFRSSFMRPDIWSAA